MFVTVPVSVAVCRSAQARTDAGGAAGAGAEDVANGKKGAISELPMQLVGGNIVDIQNSPRMKTPISALVVFWKASKMIDIADVKVPISFLAGGVKSPLFI